MAELGPGMPVVLCAQLRRAHGAHPLSGSSRLQLALAERTSPDLPGGLTGYERTTLTFTECR
jgi:hypothetical protein